MLISELLLKGKETVAFRVSNHCPSNSEFATIILDVVYVRTDKGIYDNSIGFYDNYTGEKNQYKGLIINGHMSKRTELPCGWELCSRTSQQHITLTNAEDIIKVMRPINRKLGKIADNEGSVDTFIDYVIRIGRVLGVKAYYEKRDNNREHQLNNNIGNLKNHLKSIIRHNNKKLGYACNG